MADDTVEQISFDREEHGERLRYCACWWAGCGKYSELFEDLAEARVLAEKLLAAGASVVYIEHQRYQGPGWLSFETEDVVSETKRRLFLGSGGPFVRGMECGVCHRHFSSKDSAFIEVAGVAGDTLQFRTVEGNRLVCDECAEKYAPEQMEVVSQLSGVDKYGRWTGRAVDMVQPETKDITKAGLIDALKDVPDDAVIYIQHGTDTPVLRGGKLRELVEGSHDVLLIPDEHIPF
jgi:hypothetical protein